MVFQKGNKINLGRKFPKEHCENISKAKKGNTPWNKGKKGIYSKETLKKMSKARKGCVSTFKGKHHTKESKAKLRLQHLGMKYSEEVNIKKGLKGENNPAWLGGISKLPYAFDFNKELKEKIKQRDNFTCQLCGDIIPKRISQKERLVIHHIDYDRKNSNEDNLITLCNLCNLSVNTNRDEWTKQFKNKMNSTVTPS